MVGFNKELTFGRTLLLTMFVILALFLMPRCCHMIDQPENVPHRYVNNMIQSIVIVHASIDRPEFDAYGSGIVILKQGELIYVLTSAHFFGDEEVRIELAEQKLSLSDIFDVEIIADVKNEEEKLERIKAPAKIYRVDHKRDLALITMRSIEQEFIPAQIARKEPYVGEDLWVVGNPLGMHGTLTKGVLSSKDRMRESGNVFWQTDAGAVSGSSGGGVFNKSGRLVGVVSGVAAQRSLPFPVAVTFMNYFTPLPSIKEFIKHSDIELR